MITPAFLAFVQQVCAVLKREGAHDHLTVPETECVADAYGKAHLADTCALAIIMARRMSKASPGLRELIEYQARAEPGPPNFIERK